MSDTPRTIYRRPEQAGKRPTTANMKRGEPIALDAQRLARAGSVQSITGRQRVNGLRAVVITLLLVSLVSLGAVVLIALSGAGSHKAHAQTEIVNAPCPNCIYMPLAVKR